MANKTASWQINFGPGSKSSVNTALGAATISGITSLNSPADAIDETDSTLLAHFAAGISMAQSALAVLTGSAPNLRVSIVGYRDLVSVQPSAYGARGSRIRVEVVEAWL